jgi:hypothetical protein
MLFSRNRRLPVVNLVILLTMLGGLLLGGWTQANVSFDLNLGNEPTETNQWVANTHAYFEIFQ